MSRPRHVAFAESKGRKGGRWHLESDPINSHRDEPRTKTALESWARAGDRVAFSDLFTTAPKSAASETRIATRRGSPQPDALDESTRQDGVSGLAGCPSRCAKKSPQQNQPDTNARKSFRLVMFSSHERGNVNLLLLLGLLHSAKLSGRERFGCMGLECCEVDRCGTESDTCRCHNKDLYDRDAEGGILSFPRRPAPPRPDTSVTVRITV